LQRLSNHFSSPALQYENGENPLPEPSFRKNNVRRLIRIATLTAAAIITMVLIFKFSIQQQATIPEAANIVTTKPGSKSKINLPDGTLVWLNADSKITYTEDFNGSERVVELTGEAYFDVVKDKNRPFIINTKSIKIRVLGTAFNVRSYPNEKTSETSLIRGSVEVTMNDSPDKKIILKPNEKLVVKDVTLKSAQKATDFGADETPLLKLVPLHYINGDSTSIETYWTKNKLAFDGESLESVARKIERWYAVKVIIKDEGLKTENYTSAFEDESLPEVLNALKLTGNFKYTINKKVVTITK
jgi:ferric-dicitrate binding protein FerR (iron transport regulator)